MAFLSYATHALAEKRHGLIVDVHTSAATGTAELVGALTAQGIAPHVAAKTQHSAVPEHIKATEGYRVSLRRRKMIEEAFGWLKDIGTLRRSRSIANVAPEADDRHYGLAAQTAVRGGLHQAKG